MRVLLHIRTRNADPLAERVIAEQQQRPEWQVTVTELTAPNPDYGKLLEDIFAADSVAVW